MIGMHLIVLSVHAQSPSPQGPYFGQEPPGKEAEPFAPQIITYEAHESPSISPDFKEMIIHAMEEGSKYYRMIKGAWILQKMLPFDLPPGYDNGIFLSPSGRKVYLQIWSDGDENYYVSEKKNGKWTTPSIIGEQVNSFKLHWQFSTAINENLYFSSEGQIMASVYDGRRYAQPVPLKLYNGELLRGVTPYIAPDETYLIFSAGFEKQDSDLFISYRMDNMKWTEPVNLGASINREGSLDLCPKVSPDGKYLFFISRRPGPDFKIYWADAGFIEVLRPE
jgi:hypothetical protein